MVWTTSVQSGLSEHRGRDAHLGGRAQHEAGQDERALADRLASVAEAVRGRATRRTRDGRSRLGRRVDRADGRRDR